MIPYSPTAARQVRDLIAHYERLERYEAIKNLSKALQTASDRIEQNPNIGQPFPRPYPQAAKFDFLWLKVGRYWIGYNQSQGLTIRAVFFESANIPNRLMP